MNEEDNDSSSDENIDYKAQYKTLKKKLKSLITENECFQNVLKTSQRKLLKASRDKHFLLDRLLEYEKPVFSDSSDGEATESSDDDYKRVDIKRKKPSSSSSSAGTSKPSTPTSSGGGKKKKPNASPSSGKIKSEESPKPITMRQECHPGPGTQKTDIMTLSSQKQVDIHTSSNSQRLESHPIHSSSRQGTQGSFEGQLTPSSPLTAKVKTEDVPRPITQRQSSLDGHMTPEEVERHLESTRHAEPSLDSESTEVYDGVNSASFLEDNVEDMIPAPRSL